MDGFYGAFAVHSKYCTRICDSLFLHYLDCNSENSEIWLRSSEKFNIRQSKWVLSEIARMRKKARAKTILSFLALCLSSHTKCLGILPLHDTFSPLTCCDGKLEGESTREKEVLRTSVYSREMTKYREILERSLEQVSVEKNRVPARKGQVYRAGRGHRYFRVHT